MKNEDLAPLLTARSASAEYGHLYPAVTSRRAGLTAGVLTPDAVAKYLSIKPRSVYKMVRQGAIPGFKVGGDWRFSPEDIATYLAKQKRRYGPYSSPKNHFFRPEALDTPPVQL